MKTVNRLLSLVMSAAAILLVSGCASIGGDGITQVATIDALLCGVYDGHVTLAQLGARGDFGIGTFDRLDGEMVLLDGVFYKIRADGRVCLPEPMERTPFACVTRFTANERIGGIRGLNLPSLEAAINAVVPEPNRFCAFRLYGTFDHVRTRSVPAQDKPYRPLAEITPNQPEFDLRNVRGTLIGFRSPPFVKGVNVPGYHLHFLADDLSGGGHVLAFDLAEGEIELDTRHDWLHVLLPTESDAFATADLSRDRSRELDAVEK